MRGARVALVGTGVIGSRIAPMLIESNPDLDLLVIDSTRDRASALASSLRPARVAFDACDALDSPALAGCLQGCRVVVNAAHPAANISIMQAALVARCHYLDLGGLFHKTLKQLELASDFERRGLMAVIGMGAGPGITNVLGAYAAAQLDQVEALDFAFAAHVSGDPGTTAFSPPYSIHTLMQEFAEESIQYIDGALVTEAPMAGAKLIEFPKPIGSVQCVYTLHSEPATVPASLASAGIRRVTWRLGLPESVAGVLRALASAGLGSTRPVTISGATIRPVDALAVCLEAYGREHPSTGRLVEHGCLRAEAVGMRDGCRTRVTADCMLSREGTESMTSEITAAPAAIVTMLLAETNSVFVRPGVHPPERVVAPGHLFPSLAARGFRFTNTVHTENSVLELMAIGAYPPTIADGASS